MKKFDKHLKTIYPLIIASLFCTFSFNVSGQNLDSLIKGVDYYILASQKDSTLPNLSSLIEEAENPEELKKVLLILNDNSLYDLTVVTRKQ